MADVATVAEENVVGVHVVKSFAQEEAEQGSSRTPRRRCSGRRSGEPAARVYVPMLAFLPLLAQGAVLLVGGRMVVNGSLSLGESSVQRLVLMLVMPLRMLGMWIGQAQRARRPASDLQVMDEPEDVVVSEGAGALPDGLGLVRFEGVAPATTGAAHLRRDRPRARARSHRRAHRPHGLRQDDARVAGAAVLRRDRRMA